MYVWLDVDQREARHHLEDVASSDVAPLVESLQDPVAYLREQLAAERRANDENRRLLLAALERIPPQLEPPSEAEDAPESPPSTGPPRTPSSDTGEQETAAVRPFTEEGSEPRRRSWWREFFGFE